MSVSLKEDSDLLQLQNFLTFRMAKVQARLNAQAMRILKKTAGIGLSQWRVIAMIGTGGGEPVLAAEIKRATGYDKGLFSRTLRGLIDDGLILSTTVREDQRRQALCLTAAGAAVYNRTLPVMRRRQENLRNTLEPQEVSALYTALEKLELAAEYVETDACD